MKRSLRILLLAFIVMSGVSFNRVFAQTVNNYVYSYSTPSYVAITGTSLVTGTSSWNGGMVFTGVPIGFTFYFEGQPYTTVGVSSNGFIWFGSGIASTTEYNPISDAVLGTGTFDGVVSGYGTQLDAFSTTLKDAPSGAPEISYTTTGSPCSQAFTVQWKGAYAASTGDGTLAGDDNRVDLQIVLNQTTNTINIWLHVNPYPYVASSTGEVGLRGATNSDFISLTCWAAGCSQTTNNAATGKLNPSYPATKSEFTFTPPTCSFTSSTTSTNPTCGSNGTITVTPTGAGPYTYYIDNGTVIDTNTTGTFTGLSAGSYSSLVTNGTCSIAGCATLTSSVTTPTATNTGPVCLGGTVTLNTPTVTNATYGWIGPNGYTSSQQNPVITGITAADTGVYTVFDTVGGCASGPGTTDVKLSAGAAAPMVGSNSPVCIGATLNLTDATSGATYSWTGPNGFTNSSQDPSITGVSAADSGTYTVVDTVAGCASLPATVHVVVNAIPAAPVVGSNSPVCIGATLTLGDSTGGAKYTWTGPNSFTSAVQDPTRTGVVIADSGTYTVVDTVSGCPSPPATVHVIINASPAAPGVSSNSPLCPGSTLTLIDSTSGATYSWTGPNGFTASVQDPTRTGVVAADSGTYTVVDTISGCASLPATVHVAIGSTSAAPRVGSNSPVCVGSTLTLIDSTSGATYGWTGPNGYTSGQQDPSIPNVLIADSGTYTVVDTVAGCASLPATVHVVVNPIPATQKVSSNSPLCAGSTLTLTDSVNGAKYSWSGPNSFTNAQQDPTITNVVVADSGTYSVVDTVLGCASLPATIHVLINPIPATPIAGSNSPVCVGSTLSLSNSVSGVTYSWTGPNNYTSSSQNPTINNVTFADSGVYTVVDTVSGCASAPATTDVVINQSSVISNVSSNSPVCQGDSLKLSAGTFPAVPANEYNWTGPGFPGNSNHVQSPSIPGILVTDTGYYTVVVSVPGCAVVSDSVHVNVIPGPPAVVAGNSGPVCAGQSFQLTASLVNGVTYSWSGPNGFFSGQQDTTVTNSVIGEAGSYTVTISNGGCGTSSDVTNVVINPLPTQPVVGSNSPLCAGQDLDLTVVPQSGATYSWSGPGGYTSGNQDPVINGIPAADAGYYVVTVTAGSCGSKIDSTPVAITPNTQVFVSNNGPVCAGQPVTLSATNINGATYSWTGPNGFTGSQPSDTISNTSAVNAGQYILSVSNGVCGTSLDTTSVVINAIPTTPVAGSNSPLCAGSNLDLTVVPQTGATYSWSGPNGFIGGVQDPMINGVTSADSGNYVVTVTVGTCGSLSDTILVVVNPGAPAVTASSNGPTICSNQTLQLNVTAVAGATYTWSGPNGFQASIQTPSVDNISTANSGVYSVTVTTGCGSSTSSTDVSVVTSAIPPQLFSNSPLCIGNPLFLSSNLLAGATYEWSGPNGFNSTSPDDTITNVQVLDSGVYTLSATVPGCGTASSSIDIVVKIGLPAPNVTSNSPICQGDTLTLSGQSNYPPDSTNYSWFNPQDSVISVSPSTFVAHMTGAKAGTYYYYVVSAGCTGIDSVKVKVNPLPIVKLPSATYCRGDSAVLNVGGGYESYHWSNNSTDSELVVFGIDTQITSSVTITDTNGCVNSTSVTSVFLPKADTVLINQNGDTLTASWTNGLVYQWYADDSIINGATNNFLIIDSTGHYSVVITDNNGCNNLSANDYFVLTGINNVTAAGGRLMLYPNPASGSIFLSASEDIDMYMIYDVEGREIARKEDIKAQSTLIDLHGWAKGVYYLHATMGQETYTLRFAVME